MTVPGFTAQTTLYRSRANYSVGVSSAYAGGNSVTPAFWREIGEFISDVASDLAAPACRASCWAAGGVAAGECTVATFGTLAPLCLAGVGALASACSDAC
jgi:hypothetical protein